VHVVEAGVAEERRMISFRDCLREHPDVAREYGESKRQLASHDNADHADSREAYAQAKTALVTVVARCALAEGYPRAF
jgi:GrpB-like predicted nucleotidyltransferase (UPF0157 family)